MNRAELRRRIAAITYRSLYWARHHVAPGVRSLLGLLLMAGGVVGFLPVLGFWMLPLGVAFVALDIPGTRHYIELWMIRLARDAAEPPTCRSDLLVAKPSGCRSGLPAANGFLRGREAVRSLRERQGELRSAAATETEAAPADQPTSNQ